MKQINITFDAPLHHTCLMYGLKRTFEKMPFLNKRVLYVSGKIMLTDNIVAPPPMMSNPRQKLGCKRVRNIVDVSYWKERLSVEYDDALCKNDDATAFVEALIRDYLHYRHPFKNVSIESGRVLDVAGGNIVAEIL